MELILDREELAWAAGFFDGEGSVGCYTTENGKSYRSPRLMLQIAQTDPEVLNRFRDAVGVGRVTGPYSPKTKNSSPYWCYRMENFEKVQVVVALLWHWLSSQKRRDAHASFSKYLDWANNGLCQRGHEMQSGKGGRRFCRTCRSDSGKKRWNREMENCA